MDLKVYLEDGREAKQYYTAQTPINEYLREAILELVYYKETLITK